MFILTILNDYWISLGHWLAFIFLAMILFLSKKTEFLPCWYSQIDLSYYLHWKGVFDVSISFTFCEKVFNSEGCLTCLYWGCCSCLSRKECVSLVWQIYNWDRVTCSFLDFMNAGLQSHKASLIKKNLLWLLLFQYFCHFVWRNY